MFSLDGDSRSLHISGGQGGSGGPAHLQGGTGGVGQGPIVHITASQLITHNLQATAATDQALRLGNIRAAQIASHCPPPSRIFCGREDILDKMHQFFSDTGIQHIYVLHGLGGAGRTQIALKFINKLSSHFSDIFFIDTSTIATIETGLKNIAVLKDFGDSLEAGLLWLTSKVEEWLLLFDNADDLGINLNDYIPQCNHGNIIITSRNPEMCVYAGSDSLVSDMEEEDAVTLLLKSALQKAMSHTEQIAAEIVKTLHYLPLAVVQAGAFISKSRNLDGYLALYMENQARLLSEKPAQSHDRYAWTVIGHSSIIMESLKKSSAMHQERSEWDMQLASLLLCPHVELAVQMGAEVAVTFTYQYALVFWEGGEYKHAGELLEEVLQKQKQVLGEDHPNTLRTMELESVVLEKQKQFLGEDHPHTLLTMGNLANSYCALGEHQRAQELMSVVLEKRKQVLSKDHPHTLLTMGNLAISYSHLGEHQKANELMSVVLEKQTQFLDTLLTMGNLANSYFAQGEHQRTRELMSVVLEKRKQVLGKDHPHTLHAMGKLAKWYSDLGAHQKAKALMSVVSDKWKQVMGENHPQTLYAMRKLANSYSALGEHRRAQELMGAVLEKQTQFLGEDHPDTLLTMGNLANSYSALGQHQRAKELKSVVLEKQKRLLGNNHPSTLLTMGNLANSYSALGQHQRAQELRSVVLEKQKQVLGGNHPDTLHVMRNLANSYSALGEHEEAKELMGKNRNRFQVAMVQMFRRFRNC
ncbi:hypothetical protein B0H16DRAFT_1695692 [Mycena metata]|uniref:Kinesin light chain n=1 Tax=Mycena metata TaxID=1033252 RepID=A0AAD7I4X7_9AGAR|nr:hypothetical protein B0H16DRAFT_1695692 [Mycena metata]